MNTVALSGPDLDALVARIPSRPLLVRGPAIRFALEPGDRVLVSPGDEVEPGTAIAERTVEGVLVDAGRLAEPSESGGDGGTGWIFRRGRGGAGERPLDETGKPAERRTRTYPGKWWVGGTDRRGRGRDRTPPPLAGTLLYEVAGRWQAVAGENHRMLESPVAGVVREARNAVGITIAAAGVALPGALAAGQPSRGRLDVPPLPDGELWASALDVSRSGGVVVAGSRISAQAIGRARAMSIRGLVAASVGTAEVRDLQASESRQLASLAPSPPFGLLVLDGHQRRPIASPVLAVLESTAGTEAAIVLDPPLLVFEREPVIPELPAGWVRVRGGSEAGREGRLAGHVDTWRFRSGVNLGAALVLLDGDSAPTAVALGDLERYSF